jgi:flagellar biogenesis protein FliO
VNEGAAWLLELLRVLAALVVVLGLTWVVLRYGLPRLLGQGRAKGVPIEVLGVRPLDRQVKLAVVVAEGRRLLLAFGPGGVTALVSRPLEATESEAAEEPSAADGGEKGTTA